MLSSSLLQCPAQFSILRPLQNISIAAPGRVGLLENEPELLWGMEEGLIYGLVFDNVTIGNQTVDNIEYFHHNQFVLDDIN